MIDWPVVTSGAIVLRQPAVASAPRPRIPRAPVHPAVWYCALGLVGVLSAGSFAIAMWPRQTVHETSVAVANRDQLAERSDGETTTSEPVAERQGEGRQASFFWETPPSPAPALSRPVIPDPPAYRIVISPRPAPAPR